MGQQRPRKRIREATNDGTCTLTSLDQLRALADPLRLRILSVFARGPHTTKQVAESLGEKPTRLYHHVEALARAKVIELKETRPNRGTVERYYQAVATRFTVADSLLATGTKHQPASGALSELVASIFDSTRDDLARCAATQQPGRSIEDAPLVARGLISGSRKRIAALRGKLTALLDSQAGTKGTPGSARPSDEVTYALTVAFYPLPVEA